MGRAERRCCSQDSESQGVQVQERGVAAPAVSATPPFIRSPRGREWNSVSSACALCWPILSPSLVALGKAMRAQLVHREHQPLVHAGRATFSSPLSVLSHFSPFSLDFQPLDESPRSSGPTCLILFPLCLPSLTSFPHTTQQFCVSSVLRIAYFLPTAALPVSLLVIVRSLRPASSSPQPLPGLLTPSMDPALLQFPKPQLVPGASV